jgi:hypothetical protein
LENDIALIKTAEKIKFSPFIMPLRLGAVNPSAGYYGVVSG